MPAFEPYIVAKIYFPAMPTPFEVRLTCQDLRYLDMQMRRHLLPDSTVIYSQPDRPTACVACMAPDGEAPTGAAIGQLIAAGCRR